MTFMMIHIMSSLHEYFTFAFHSLSLNITNENFKLSYSQSLCSQSINHLQNV